MTHGIGSFETDAPVANAAWGDHGSVLYIAADTAIYRVRLTDGSRGPG